MHPDTRTYAVIAFATALLEAALRTRAGLEAVTAADAGATSALAHLHTGPLSSVARATDLLANPWAPRAALWAALVALAIRRSVRHLLIYLVVVLAVALLAAELALTLGRMRPTGVDVLAGWRGPAHPSLPVAVLAVVLLGAVRTLAPRGRARRRGLAAAAAAVLGLGLARAYLGVDAPSDVLAALGVGWALPAAALELAVPDEAFPVGPRRDRPAHLDTGGERGRAVRQAVAQQLGLTVTALEPFGWEGSAGSTPLRVRVTDGARERTLFAKLYAVTHLRSDRAYKATRTVLYGRLEDEKPFSSVRRLVEYEDHLLRLMRDVGLPTPAPAGIVEITPEREYLLLMEFFDRAEPVGTREPTDTEIDDALGIVRRMWETGLAHRDIKPSNLLVQDGRVKLLDVAFATVRPTPWRQAVDLADMMLTLALHTTPERVYERALALFAPADIAEAFAATRGVTIPGQLRGLVRADGRELVGAFRALAPERRPVSVQLWSGRRVGVTALVLAGVVGCGWLVAAVAGLAGLL